MHRDCIGGFQWLVGILPAGRRLALPALIAVLCTACSDTLHVYKMYGGPARPDSAIVFVDLGDTVEATVGPRTVSRSDYDRLALLPGRYAIRWRCVYGVSVMIEPSGWAAGEGSAEVLLEAGHQYSMHCSRTTGFGYETFQWLKDDTTGEVVAGARKP